MGTVQSVIDRQIAQWNRMQTPPPAKGEKEPDEDAAMPNGLPERLPVIAFSRELGCGSRQVTGSLSRRTGFEVFGSSLIDKVAEDIQVARRIVDRLDERAKSSTEMFLERLLWGRQVKGQNFFESLVRVVRALIEQGGVILLGRGTHFMVEESGASGLRVRLRAPMDMRIRNVMEFYNIDSRTAETRIHKSDQQRMDFARAYFKKDIDDPSHVDLTINMANLSTSAAVDIIHQAYRSISSS